MRASGTGCRYVLGVVVSVAALHAPLHADEAHLPPWTLRLGGGLAVPFGELSNDDPSQGWLGGQGSGLHVEAGARLPLVNELFVRPELTFYRFGAFRDRSFPIIVLDGSAEPDTVDSDWRRETFMVGLRVALDYIPASTSALTVFLTGGLGFSYMRFDDDIRIPDRGRIDDGEDAVGMSASGGVGLKMGRVELVLGFTAQQPSFSRSGSASWTTGDLRLGVEVPSPFR